MTEGYAGAAVHIFLTKTQGYPATRWQRLAVHTGTAGVPEEIAYSAARTGQNSKAAASPALSAARSAALMHNTGYALMSQKPAARLSNAIQAAAIPAVQQQRDGTA